MPAAVAAAVAEFPARGKVVRAGADTLVFNPVGTNYEIKLACPTAWAGPVGQVVPVVVRASARKLWTIGSGGNFVAPIFGPPRIVQGRVRHLDQTTIVVQCGLTVYVTLPTGEAAIDLGSGPLAVGALVNVALLPGATAEAG